VTDKDGDSKGSPFFFIQRNSLLREPRPLSTSSSCYQALFLFRIVFLYCIFIQLFLGKLHSRRGPHYPAAARDQIYKVILSACKWLIEKDYGFTDITE
jgi:hypothetical protein